MTTDSNPLPLVDDGALYRYIRHKIGDVDLPRAVREAKKIRRTVRKLAEAGDRDAIRIWLHASTTHLHFNFT